MALMNLNTLFNRWQRLSAVVASKSCQQTPIRNSILQQSTQRNIVNEITSNSRGIGGHLRKVAVEFRANGTPCIRVVV
ncbi:hypothetical protein ANTPLA_LOCUS6398 [Anthophora plagiata]